MTSLLHWDSLFWSSTKSPERAVVRNCQPSLFSDLLGLQPWALFDQGQHANKNCQRTAPTRLFGLHRKERTQVLMFARTNLEILPDQLYPTVFVAYWQSCKIEVPIMITTMGPFPATIFQIFVLAELCSDLVATKTLVLPVEDREEQISFLQ